MPTDSAPLKRMTGLFDVARLKPNERSQLVLDALIEACRFSVLHGDTSAAKKFVNALPRFVRTKKAVDSLISVLEKWGNLLYRENKGDFEYKGVFNSKDWDSSKENSIRDEVSAVFNQKKGTSPADPYLDAEVEIRKVLARLKKRDSKYLLHSDLITRIQQVMWDYGLTDVYEKETKRARTLFDASVANQTQRASKYSK